MAGLPFENSSSGTLMNRLQWIDSYSLVVHTAWELILSNLTKLQRNEFLLHILVRYLMMFLPIS